MHLYHKLLIKLQINLKEVNDHIIEHWHFLFSREIPSVYVPSLFVEEIIVEFLIAWFLSLWRSSFDIYGSILSILTEALSTETLEDNGDTGAFSSSIGKL